VAVAVAIQKKDNPLYPLPPDYMDLSEEGRREARVNACRQWLLHNKPEEKFAKAEAFVHSLNFFDKYYLHPEFDEAGDILWDPLFYDFPPCPVPDFRWSLYRARILYRLMVGVAPRGSTKSKGLAIEMMLEMLTRPAFSIIYATSINTLAEEMGEQVKNQLYFNDRIQDDWAGLPEFGGAIKPKRGEGSAGMTRFVLNNRSSFFATSAESRQRGKRPIRYYLDDPEFDPRGSTSLENIREWMGILLFNMVLPMVQRPGCGVTWLGTFVTQRHYLHYAMSTKMVARDGKMVEEAVDPRFKKWYRIFVPAEAEVDGVRTSAWPAMWPVNEKEKKALGLNPETQTLDAIQEEIGAPAYAAEYLGKPGEGGARFFPNISDENHWWYEKSTIDAMVATDPTRSTTTICWLNQHGETQRLQLKDFLSTAWLMCLLDTSYTNTPDSDFKVAHVIAIYDGMIFSMDMWSAQCPQEMLIEEALRISDKWKVSVIYPEHIKAGISLYEDLIAIVRARMKNFAGVEHLPEVVKYSPGVSSKEGRIAALNLWFKHGQIKLPRDENTGPYARLLHQIAGFNPYSDAGGLQHDDELDTLAWPIRILRARGGAYTEEKEEPDTRTAAERLKDGELTDEQGNGLIVRAMNEGISVQDVMELLDRVVTTQKEKESLA